MRILVIIAAKARLWNYAHDRPQARPHLEPTVPPFVDVVIQILPTLYRDPHSTSSSL